ncbi:hypothetical protein Murru_0426 [Allomuricauda ruestringensis DSM 13258]|uniref:Uncharacterized protein n=1 Tax=Allomuricauda ruestringensis (strain DSM 13258 / CIP 107369 / LMG 19739 / B1) TaxID=886377 RepID=G2PRN1_ALLRU|nr:hypothetical protein Murru_0426 [Allomuricauda ruestringensis DSM 13258]
MLPLQTLLCATLNDSILGHDGLFCHDLNHIGISDNTGIVPLLILLMSQIGILLVI